MTSFYLILLPLAVAVCDSTTSCLSSSSTSTPTPSSDSSPPFTCSQLGYEDSSPSSGSDASEPYSSSPSSSTTTTNYHQRRGLGLFLYLLGLVGGLIMFALYKPDENRMDATKRRDSGDSDASEGWTRKRDFRSLSFYAAWLGLEPEGTTFMHFKHFTDRFVTYNEVRSAMSQAGLEKARVIVGIDFTASNEWQGRKSFHGNSLHTITGNVITRSSNPYQRVIAILGGVLEPFTEGQIHALGFGDTHTRDQSVFYLHRDNRPCDNFPEVLRSYNQRVKRVQLSGPTSYAPLIHRAIDEVKSTKTYHILIIIADGQMPEEGPSMEAIVQASEHPLSIIMIGVGDGPWNTMENFDDKLPSRAFDNFQFVNFSRATHRAKHPETNFALHAFMEVPDQYKAIKALGLLDYGDHTP